MKECRSQYICLHWETGTLLDIGKRWSAFLQEHDYSIPKRIISYNWKLWKQSCYDAERAIVATTSTQTLFLQTSNSRFQFARQT
ncbi:hypothetical protein M758_8G080900 [Ceratodon purpureus]|nr:hypothetical protein M758_8G080900 [Ceratodon purpureus]